jgi:hypothetical protein
MSLDRRIDALIEVGWYVVESDFDETAVQHWRKRAIECVAYLSKPFETQKERLDKNFGRVNEEGFLRGQDLTNQGAEKTRKQFPSVEHLFGNGSDLGR